MTVVFISISSHLVQIFTYKSIRIAGKFIPATPSFEDCRGMLQLFQPWYSSRKPLSWVLPGTGVGERVGVGEGTKSVTKLAFRVF
jgi:hypothetical protein